MEEYRKMVETGERAPTPPEDLAEVERQIPTLGVPNYKLAVQKAEGTGS
jgi:hypothetical protein